VVKKIYFATLCIDKAEALLLIKKTNYASHVINSYSEVGSPAEVRTSLGIVSGEKENQR
jgi:hypothetical protein